MDLGANAFGSKFDNFLRDDDLERDPKSSIGGGALSFKDRENLR